MRLLLVVTLFTYFSSPARAQNPFVGEVKTFAGNFAPSGWAICDGSLLPIAEYETLFNLIGTTYGGDGQSTFALPDLRGRVAISQGQGSGLSDYVIGQTGGVENVTLNNNQIPSHSHSIEADIAPGSSGSPLNAMLAEFRGSVPVYSTTTTTHLAAIAVSYSGGSQPHNNLQPYLALNYIISLFGVYPSQSETELKKAPGVQEATSPYLGEIILVSFNFAPKGWLTCSGQLLPVNQNAALFSLLGTTYGGDGRTTFALPDLRGRVPVGVGSSSNISEGQVGGEESHTLTVGEMPAHSHVIASNATATTASPANAVFARPADGGLLYSAQNSASTGVGSLTYTGGGQPHENRKPYVTMMYVISSVGVFPSRN
jgi:microcystin-dependent protein